MSETNDLCPICQNKEHCNMYDPDIRIFACAKYEYKPVIVEDE